ncbi:hypothetical protein [Marinobacter sp. CA1]|uniref:hypothetical protein n=1 Tax=Marinobacter sp. CA1 TaxID=2817656 RepID=UPI001D086FB9|nr:hypothetical protein [Marinobacter sp. CA1]UDL05816.1 hypothetical protein J2887_03345 [Marinobacter sp. CA1]
MGNVTAAERYTTADFRSTPLIALADLMGLSEHQVQIARNPELYSPILNGIALYRHLPASDRRQVNSAIIHDVPYGGLTTKLMGLIGDLSVQRFWYMWSLSDDELLEFFQFSKDKEKLTSQFSPLSLPDFTISSIATGVFLMSQKGPRAFVSAQLQALKESELVKEVAKRLGLSNRIVGALGAFSVPSLIVISGINIMAKKESEMARKELAARGLLAYSEL